MKGLFIIVIVLVVLWFINQHTKKYEPFETNEEEKVELSLCDLVTLIKKLLLNKHSNMNQLSHKVEPHVKQIRHDLEQDVQEVRQQIREDVRQDLEQVMSVESVNMNIINTVEPNDDDIYSNQSLFAQIE
jgi:hypothetical protein